MKFINFRPTTTSDLHATARGDAVDLIVKFIVSLPFGDEDAIAMMVKLEVQLDDGEVGG